MNPSELRDHFLNRAAPLVDAYIDAALGTKDLDSYDSDARKEVWGILKRLLLASTDKLDMPHIEGPEDVLKAVESGKCTLEQAQMLIEMYNQVRYPQGGGPGQGGPLFNITVQSFKEDPDNDYGVVIDAKDKQQVEGSRRGIGSVPMVEQTAGQGGDSESNSE